MKRFSFALLVICAFQVFLNACSSGMVAYERGDYFQAVLTSVDRLRRNSDHSKSAETLRQAYPLAVSFYEDRAKASLASNARFKWTSVVESYSTINVMYDEIRRSPGALKVIPNPVNYHSKLQEAKQNAAEENYAAGVEALAMNNRDKAKEAHRLFKTANGFVPGYKDVIQMTEAARWAATVKVLVEPIPVQSANVSVSTTFFNDKVSEYLHQNSINEYVRFFTRAEAEKVKLNPDHIVKLEFDEFTVGQVFLYEKEMPLENNVVVGSYVSQPTQNNQDEKDTGNTDKPVPPPANNNPPKDTTPPQEDAGKKDTPPPTNDKPKNDQPKDKPADNNGKDVPTDSLAEKDRVMVCHIPPGNEAARHTLVIAKTALAAHLAHGDKLGECETTGEKGKSDKDQKKPNDKPKDDKTNENKQDNKKDNGKGNVSFINATSSSYLLASADDFSWLAYTDTTKIYGSVKATLYYSRKTTTSKGVVSFKIIDAKTNALLAVEKIPGEYTWTSEWATFNGDERALTPQQLKLSKQREQVPPPPQDLFVEFTRPIYDQLVNKLQNFYKGY